MANSETAIDAMNKEREQVLKILTDHKVDPAEPFDAFDHQACYEALFELWQYEMPYGTQKAHTGDPYQWVSERVADILEE